VLRALSPFDIGPAAVVVDGHVSRRRHRGTDGLLAAGGAVAPRRGVFGQGRRGRAGEGTEERTGICRFDLPTLGPRTIKALLRATRRNRHRRRNTIVAEPQAMIEVGWTRRGLFVTGLPA